MLINLKLTEINSYDEPPIVGRANNRQFWAASRRVRKASAPSLCPIAQTLSSLSQADSAAIRLWPLPNAVDLRGRAAYRLDESVSEIAGLSHSPGAGGYRVAQDVLRSAHSSEVDTGSSRRPRETKGLALVAFAFRETSGWQFDSTVFALPARLYGDRDDWVYGRQRRGRIR
jgi:hypothetical protein